MPRSQDRDAGGKTCLKKTWRKTVVQPTQWSIRWICYWTKLSCTGSKWKFLPVLAVCIYSIFIWKRHFPGISHFWTFVDQKIIEKMENAIGKSNIIHLSNLRNLSLRCSLSTFLPDWLLIFISASNVGNFLFFLKYTRVIFISNRILSQPQLLK